MKGALITGGCALAAALLAGGATLWMTSGPSEARTNADAVEPLQSSSDATTMERTSSTAVTDLSSQQLHTPERGSAERAALMDSLRLAVEPELGTDVIFVVTELQVKGDWAFGVLEPVHADGSAIDMMTTPLVRAAGGNVDMFDGLRIEAIWRWSEGRWHIQAHGIGATDVWFEDYCTAAPAGLIPVCRTQPALPETSAIRQTRGGSGHMDYAAIDRLTTYAVLLGRGVGCGIDTRSPMAKVGGLLDRVAPPGSTDQQVYLPMFMAGVEQNARAQATGRSPDSCNTVARAIRQHPWP